MSDSGPSCKYFAEKKHSRIRNKQMFTNARAFSRVSYFLYFFCFSRMFCGKKVVVVFLWNHIHICMPSFWFFIFVCDEKFHRNIKTMLLVIQFCLCILNSPRSKYFIKFSFMVFDSQICSANTISRSIMLIDYTLRKATSFIPYEIFPNTYHGRRILRKKTDGWRYTTLKKQPVKQNTIRVITVV